MHNTVWLYVEAGKIIINIACFLKCLITFAP